MTALSPGARRKLPIGLQTLAELRSDGCYYADKSGYAVDLAQAGKYYFLSRPRRFGKSLFLDTLKEMFEGNAALFQGLAAETRWDWTRTYPVIRISLGAGVLKNRTDLNAALHQRLHEHETRWSLHAQFADALACAGGGSFRSSGFLRDFFCSDGARSF